MKEVTNKKTELLNEKKENLNYGDLIKTVIGTLTADGVTIAQMRQRMKIIDVCTAGGEVLSFEDTDFSFIKDQISFFRWGVMNKDIIDFGEYIAEMK